MKKLNTPALLALAAMTLSLAACGGGGSSGGSGVAGPMPPMPSASPTPTPTPPPTLSGKAVDLVSGAPLAGFTVSVGALPNASSCLTGQSATVMTCGVPAGALVQATTTATGTFSMTLASGGLMMVTIGKDGTYATLHRSVQINPGSNDIGYASITALSTDEQNWLVDANKRRATVSFPTSYANMLVDEYAQEQARQWAMSIAAGTTVYSDAGYAPYQSAYKASPGAMYGATGVLDLVNSASEYVAADDAWISEKANCPNGNWSTCPFAGNTGHYINLSNTNTVWVGLAESATSFDHPPNGPQWAYNLMLIENVSQVSPASTVKLPQ